MEKPKTFDETGLSLPISPWLAHLRQTRNSNGSVSSVSMQASTSQTDVTPPDVVMNSATEDEGNEVNEGQEDSEGDEDDDDYDYEGPKTSFHFPILLCCFCFPSISISFLINIFIFPLQNVNFELFFDP